MSFLTPELYCKAWSWIFGIYGVQMLAVPAKMITDHFEAPATPLLTFWVRGQSVSLLGLIYCVSKLNTEAALPICAACSAAIAVLYPYNAKFNLIGEKLPIKYPMHYVPEVLMAVVTAAGAFLLAQ
eukprot:PRCOL_00003001-RA